MRITHGSIVAGPFDALQKRRDNGERQKRYADMCAKLSCGALRKTEMLARERHHLADSGRSFDRGGVAKNSAGVSPRRASTSVGTMPRPLRRSEAKTVSRRATP